MKQLSATLLLALTSFLTLAQTYGNEWIEYNQTYYKFQIGEDGVYRISYQDLTDAGIPVGSVAPANIQLFKNGVEQQIFVSGEGDGTFDVADFIEFYGTKNRGELDEALYRSVGEHTNPYHSLYTDTAAYFLTWSATPSSKHLASYYDGNYTGKTGDSYFLYESIEGYGTDYFTGIPNNNNLEQTFSEYTEGEGYVGKVLNSLGDFAIPTPAPYIGGPNAQMEIKAYGRNNPPEFINGYNHEFGVALGNKTNILKTIEHNGYTRVDINYSDLSIAPSQLSDVTTLYLGEVTRSNSLHQVPYIKIKYARAYDLQNGTDVDFTSTTNAQYFEFENYNSSSSQPIIIDRTNKNRITGDVVSGALKFNTAQGNAKDLMVYDASNVKSITGLNESTFTPLTAQGINYLIVSNSKLAASAQEYADYRSSATGGNYTVAIINADELYDQFYYGIHHPLAVRNAIYFMLNPLSEPLDNILLLGKGQTYSQVRNDPAKRDQLDLVPTLGSPPTDYLFVSSLDVSDLTIQVPIGRVAAQNDEQVRDYLNKVKAHESAPPAEWQKKIIQVIGGEDEQQNTQYRSFVDAYFNIAKDSFLGGHRVVFAKDEAVDISTSLIDKIQAEVDQGATIFNYFGHGSAQVLEVAIGEPEDLNNYGKYPFFVFNGCALGNCYVDVSIGEQYLFEKDKGAVSWLASTGFGFTAPLLSYTRIFHEELLRNKYGLSIGESLQSTIARYQNKNDNVNVQNCRQLVYQGDPAIKLNSAALPDVTVRDGRLNSDFSFRDKIEVDIDLLNLGKTSRDSVTLIVTAQNSDSTSKVFEGDFGIPDHSEKQTLAFDKTDFFTGLVRFTIEVDPKNNIAEINPEGEMNNIYSFEQLFALKKPLLIYPKLNSIVNKADVDFVFQIVNSKNEDIQINIELDTTPDFDNGGLAQYTFTTDRNIVNYTAAMPPIDGKDYFYRIKTVQNGDESEWSTSAFAYLFGKDNGWSESDYENLRNINKSFITLDSPYVSLEFGNRISNQYKIETNGVDEAGFNWNIFTIAGEFDIIWNFKPDGIRVVAFHPNTEKRFSTSSQYNLAYPPNSYWTPDPKQPDQDEYYVIGNKTGVYEFKTSIKAERDSFLALLKSIPDGYHVMLHNERNTAIETWEDEIFDELMRFGIVDLKGKKEGEPFALFGTKGDPSQSVEKYADYSSTVPPTQQKVELAFNIFPKVTDGSVTTERIGPATSWSSVEMRLKDDDSRKDFFSYDVIGVDTTETEKVLFSRIATETLDITSIDVLEYPYVRVRLNLSDSLEYTPLNVDRWTVFYEGVTEGSIDTDQLDFVSSDTLQQGDVFMFGTAFKNISPIFFDSSQLQVRIVNESGISTEISTMDFDTIFSGESVEVRDTIETTELSGLYQMYVTANHDRTVLENEFKNNLYYKEFYVRKDFRNPFLDVTFDGIHILNNDIVSSNTVIVITGKDDNEFLLLDDPSLFHIVLRHPDQRLDTLDQLDPTFSFTPSTSPSERATITYNAVDFPDGLYTLSAKLKDRTGNGEGAQAYEIDFRIINKKSISNIYPYPNPFTTCAKFVFTITGSEVPDRMKISIYTITGRLVKQIDETELGSIRIGNNLTDYCWDGTDDFGDRLANGVYLYKAEIYSNGQKVDLMETEGDHLFNNGFGKLYMAR